MAFFLETLSCHFRKKRRNGRRGTKARDTLKPPCVFNLGPLAPSTLCSQMLQKIILLCFSPVFWKWPNNCQEEECEAFPGVVHDVSALRRPLLFCQFGYSRAHSTKTPNSWSQLLPSSSSKTIQKKRMVHNIWILLFTDVNRKHDSFSTLRPQVKAKNT